MYRHFVLGYITPNVSCKCFFLMLNIPFHLFLWIYVYVLNITINVSTIHICWEPVWYTYCMFNMFYKSLVERFDNIILGLFVRDYYIYERLYYI